ncbi:33470_t:CDS:2, partial [Gigaspora margarita]
LSTSASSRLALSISSSSATTLSTTLCHKIEKERKREEQQTQLGKVLKKFKIIDKFNNIKKGKGKKPSKNLADICFQNAARKLAHELFYSHVQISNEQIKEQLEKMLKSDKECAEQLQKLNDKVKPFSEKDTKEQIREWKKNSKKAYKDLYNSTVLETIFDEEYLSPKIDADVINVWIQKLNVEGNKDVCILSINDFTNLFELEVQNTILQKSSASFPAISEAVIQENYEVSSGDSSENDRSSNSNYEE